MFMNASHRQTLPAALFLFSIAATCAGGETAQTGIAGAPDELAKIIVLKIDGDRLMLDREAWEKKEDEKQKEDDNGPVQIQIQGGGGVVINQQMIMGGRMGRGNRPEPIGHFQRYMQKVSPRAMGNSMSSSNSRWEVRRQGDVNGACVIDTGRGEFTLKLNEGNEPGRTLQLEEDKATGLTLRLVQPATKQMLLLVQTPHGTVSLTSVKGDEVVSLVARDFTELLKQHPGEVQMLLFRPLRAFGPQEPLSPWLPPVMALACTGFGPAPEAIVKQADALIAQLSGDDPETRETATRELIKLYPQAVQHIAQAQEKTEDAEAKMRLRQVQAAHPTIARTRAYVEEKKLHEDKAYLREILGGVPFFKAAARARLTQLYGKDHGDDPKAWE